MTPTALREICCEECGESLGYQEAGTEVQRDLWQHNRCPERIAQQLGLTRGAYDTALRVASVTIDCAYPDFPNNVLNDPDQAGFRQLRSEIAASAVLEALSVTGFALKEVPTDG